MLGVEPTGGEVHGRPVDAGEPMHALLNGRGAIRAIHPLHAHDGPLQALKGTPSEGIPFVNFHDLGVHSPRLRVPGDRRRGSLRAATVRAGVGFVVRRLGFVFGGLHRRCLPHDREHLLRAAHASIPALAPAKGILSTAERSETPTSVREYMTILPSLRERTRPRERSAPRW
jgi:hypothetical protein